MKIFHREQSSLFGEILDWMLTPLLLLWPVSLVLTWLVAQSIAGKPFDRALEYNVGALAQLVPQGYAGINPLIDVVGFETDGTIEVAADADAETGDSFRGATWVSIHNGGGVGWGEVINGGFGMLLDGSADADRRLKQMLFWDVNNGIARRSWARNNEAVFAIEQAMIDEPLLKVTLPNLVDDATFENLNF